MVDINTYDIDGHNDFELDIARKSPLRYHIAIENTKIPEGIVFLIPGFGNDSKVSYQKNLMKYIAEKFNVIAVFTEYHSIFARGTDEKESASISFSEEDTEILLNVIDKYNIKLDENNLNTRKILRTINNHIEKMKDNGSFDKDRRVNLWATMYPYKGEYQNFGVLQALDILTVLYHMKTIGYDKIIESKPIIAQGSSHGGYIVNMIMKFAPNTFDAIIDNSCYIKAQAEFILGFEYNRYQTEFNLKFKNLILGMFTKSHWTLKETPNKFNANADEIRDLSNVKQLEQFSKYNKKTKVISYHSEFDKLAKYNEKLEYIELLKEYGYDVEFHTISKED